MYSVEDKLGFIGHPRTASRSVAQRLQVNLLAQRGKSHHQVDEETCYKIYDNGGHVACVVRNMFDVLVSWYHNVPRTDVTPDFESFVRKLIENPSQRWFRPKLYHYGLGYCDRVLRFENLQDDFDQFLLESGIATIPLVPVGESARLHYRRYYDDDLRRAVESRWGWDLQITGYEF